MSKIAIARGIQGSVRRWRIIALSWVAVSLSSGSAHAAPPQRIVSLNVCTDQILVALVPRSRIALVTYLAADPTISATPAAFAGIASSRGDAEDVLARDPDLILANPFSTPATVDLLRRLGRRVVITPFPQDIAGVRNAIAEIARAVEEPEAGARLVAKLDAQIAEVEQRAREDVRRPSALVYQVNNYVAGNGTLVDEALRIAGLRNGASGMPTIAGGQTDLETIVTSPPDLMVLATRPEDYLTTVGDNLRHPALQQIMRRIHSVVLPWPLWLCGTQHIATAIERLADARTALLAGSKP